MKQFDSMLEYALDYASRGFSVLPVRTGWLEDKETGEIKTDENGKPKPDKRPGRGCLNGVKDATTNPAKVEELFQQAGINSNLGLACFDMFVIDVDIKGGEDGFKTLAELTRGLGSLPESPVSVTRSGGKHYLFKKPAEWESTSKPSKELGIDIRSAYKDKKGEFVATYIVAPPSRYEDGAYRWEIEPTRLEDLPELPPAWVWFFALDNRYQKRFMEATDEQRADYLTNGFPVEERTVQPALPALSKSAGEVLAAFDSNHNPDTNFSEYTREEQERAVDRARAYVARIPDAIAGGGNGEKQFLKMASYYYHGLALTPSDRPFLESLMENENLRAYTSDGQPYPFEGKQFEHKIDTAIYKPFDRCTLPRGFCFEKNFEKKYLNSGSPDWLDNLTVNGQPNRPAGEAGKPAEIRFKSMLDYRQDIEARIGQPGKVLPTCFPSLNTALGGGIREGLTVIGAIPSLGKSTLAIQTADYWASIGKKVLFISLEMSKQAIAFKSFSRLTGARIIGADVDSMILDNPKRKTDILTRALTYEDIADYPQEGKRLEALADARQTYWKHIAPNLYVKERGKDDRTITADDILRYAERFIEQTGSLDALFLDYLQILNGTEPKQSPKDKADEAVATLATIGREFHLPVIVVSSLNRLGYYKRLDLDSFKESGGVEYGVDHLIGMEPTGLKSGKDNEDANRERIAETRKSDCREIELEILKSRFGRAGGSACLSFYPSCSMFTDMEQTDKTDGTAGNLPFTITESAGWNPKQTKKGLEEEIIEVIRDILINQTDSRIPLKTLLGDTRLEDYDKSEIRGAVKRANEKRSVYGLYLDTLEDEQGNKSEWVVLITTTEAELSEKKTAKLAKKTAVKQARDLEADLFLSDLLAVKPMFLGDVATLANSAGFTNEEILGAFNRLGLKQVYRLEDNQTAEYWASPNDDSLESNIPAGWKGGRKYPDSQDLRNID